MNYTRRGFVRTGVGGIVVASAGCVGVIDDGGGGDDGSSDGDDGGDPPAGAPRVTFDFEEDDDAVVITHDGGDALDPDTVTFRGPVGDWISTGQSVNTGDRITLVKSSSARSGDTLEVVWHDPSGDGEAVLGEYTLSG